jgi:phosphatidylglycerol:prolipoprotein diacylglycerol transferase
MYPDLSYFFHDFFGTAPDNWISIFKTFGFFLVLAILSAALLFYRELKRKAGLNVFKPTKVKYEIGKPPQAGELSGNAIWGFIIGYKGWYAVQNFEALKKDAGDILLTLDGSWMAGILMAVLLAGLKYWDVKKQQLPKPRIKTKKVFPHDRIGDITIIAAISGVIGAKFFDVIEHIPEFMEDPLGMLLSGGGLAIYGGLIFGFLAGGLYCRRHNIPFLPVLDAVAPALIIAYGIGRMGCHFSGDGDWGIVNTAAMPSWWFLPDWLWAYDYPHNVLKEGVPIAGCEFKYCHRLESPVYPTSVYETLMAFSIGGILYAIRKPLGVYPGMLFFVYLIFNGIERFFIEMVRVNQVYETLGFSYTQAQFIAVLMFLAGIAGVYFLWKRKQAVVNSSGS